MATSNSEHESGGTGYPERRSTNIQISAKAYETLSATSKHFFWTVPQYVGLLAEANALKPAEQRIEELQGIVDAMKARLTAAEGASEATPQTDDDDKTLDSDLAEALA